MVAIENEINKNYIHGGRWSTTYFYVSVYYQKKIYMYRNDFEKKKIPTTKMKETSTRYIKG